MSNTQPEWKRQEKHIDSLYQEIDQCKEARDFLRERCEALEQLLRQAIDNMQDEEQSMASYRRRRDALAKSARMVIGD